MNKKILMLFASTFVLNTFSAEQVAENELQEIKQLFLKQQQEIERLRQQIKDVEAVHSEAIHKYIKDEIKSEVSKQSSLLTLNKHVTNLKVKGDLRLRYQRGMKSSYDDIGNYTGKETRDRFRTRVRVGAEWQTNEGWIIGLGVATGDSEGNSSNDTFGDDGVWDSGDLRLDYAFAKHSWSFGKEGKQTLILGKMNTPFYTSKAFFDGDYRPTGVAYQIESGHIFATTGAFTVQQNDGGRDDNDTTLYAGQVGYKNDLFKAAVAYYFYNHTDGNNPGSPAFDLEDDEVHLVDAIGEVYIKINDQIKLTPYAEYAVNTEADDNDTAYMFGAALSINKFTFTYDYRRYEENSVPKVIMDSDFTGPVTGQQGSVVSAKYNFSKNLSLKAKAYLTEEIDDSSVAGEDTDRELYQLDLVYKF